SALVRIVICSIERLLKAPIQFQSRRRGLLQSAKLLQGRLDGGVTDERPSPISLKSEKSLGKILLIGIADKISAVLAQNVDDWGFGIPTQATPENFVNVVIATLGIADEANGTVLPNAKDFGFIEGSWIDDFAGFSQRISDIPIGNGELTTQTVRDVRVPTDGIFGRDHFSQFRQRHAHLRSVNHSAQPAGLLFLKNLAEFVKPLFGKTLR